MSLVFLQVFLERERLPAGAAGELTPCWVDGLGEFSKDFFEGGLRPRTSTGPARPSTSDGAGPGVRACYPTGFGMVTGAPQLDSVMSTLPWSLSMTIRTRFAAGAGVEALVSTIHKVIGSLPPPLPS